MVYGICIHPRVYTYAIHHYNPCYNIYLYCYCCTSTAVISPLSHYSNLQENAPDNTIPYVVSRSLSLSLPLSLTHSLTPSLTHSLPHLLTSFLPHSLISVYYATSTTKMNRCSKPSAVYTTIDYSKLHETAIVLVLYKQLGMTVNSIMLTLQDGGVGIQCAFH